MNEFNRTQTAEILGVPVRTLNRWLKQLEMNDQQTFSRDDINKYLRPCQAYLKKGKTFEEIKEIMAQRKSQRDISAEEGIPLEGSYDDFYTSDFGSQIPTPPPDTFGAVREGVLALTEAYSDRLADAMAEALPKIFLNQLYQKSKEGKVKAAFQRHIASIRAFGGQTSGGLNPAADGFEDWPIEEDESSAIVPVVSAPEDTNSPNMEPQE